LLELQFVDARDEDDDLANVGPNSLLSHGDVLATLAHARWL
jgi:hypothetical protein